MPQSPKYKSSKYHCMEYTPMAERLSDNYDPIVEAFVFAIESWERHETYMHKYPSSMEAKEIVRIIGANLRNMVRYCHNYELFHYFILGAMMNMYDEKEAPANGESAERDLRIPLNDM